VREWLAEASAPCLYKPKTLNNALLTLQPDVVDQPVTSAPGLKAPGLAGGGLRQPAQRPPGRRVQVDGGVRQQLQPGERAGLLDRLG